MKQLNCIPVAFLVIGLLAFGLDRQSVNADEIAWQTDYSAALREARETQRPLLVKVSARWCGYCTRMQQETLSSTAIVERVEENFVALELDADRDRELISRFRVSTYPTTIIVAPDRKILDRVTGFRSASQYDSSLRGALEKLR